MPQNGRDHRNAGRGRVSVAALVLIGVGLASGGAGCKRVESEPVAPFGGPLATPLPYPDVLGYLRCVPDDPGTRALLSSSYFSETSESLVSVLGPANAMLSLLRGRSFVAPGGAFAVLFLDSSVHGALCGFAWRGDAESFRVAARAAGFAVPSPDRVELPGHGRTKEFQMVMDGLRRRMGNNTDTETDEEVNPDDERPQSVTYHLIEDATGLLLIPARDGRRNIAATLASAHALDPDLPPSCAFEFDVGRAVREVRGELSDHLHNGLNIAFMKFNEGLAARHLNWDYWSFYEMTHDLLEGTLDALSSIDHVFVQLDSVSAELYVRAANGRFFDRLLATLKNRPVAELLADAPPDAGALLAASVDPKRIVRVPEIWRDSQSRTFRHRRITVRRFGRRSAVVPNADDDADATEELPSFVDSFGGRIWAAVPPMDVDGEGFDGTVTLFEELVNEDAQKWLVQSLAEALLPASMRAAWTAYSLLSHRTARVPGGGIEVIGANAGDRMKFERTRLEGRAPDSAGVELPNGVPSEACLLGLLQSTPLGPSITLTATRDERGLRARLLLRR